LIGVRLATSADWQAIWPVWHRVVAAGDTYCWPPDTGEAQAREYWMLPPPACVFVAEFDGVVVGTALLKPVHPGAGDHVANASFMVDPHAGGQGVGRALAEYVLDAARAADYRAMQFNAVVATNERAVALWRSLGFDILATVPEAFRHPGHGLVGLHVMHRAL
jgi:L-amino acid N-acyltransferase YncA